MDRRMKDKDASLQARKTTTRIGIAAALLLTVLLCLPPVRLFEQAQGNWLGLHLLLEVGAVVVAALVVVVSWHALDKGRRRQSNILIFGFTTVAVCDLLHALSYAGMPALWSEASTQKAILFWLAARGVETLALGLLAAGLRLPGSGRLWFGAALCLSGLLAWLVMARPEALPRMYVPGQGLSTLKVLLEYLLCLANLAIAVQFWAWAGRSGRSRGYWLAGACFVMALGELVFASYRAPEDSLNVLGHVFKVVADWLIFRAVFAVAIRQPYELARWTERSLREREAQLAALASNLPNGLLFQIERDLAGRQRFVYLSDAVQRVGELDLAEVLRDPMRLYGLLLPEDLALLQAAEQESARSMSVLDQVVRMPAADGAMRWLRVCSAPRRLDDGRIMWDGLVLDITRERLDQEAQRSNEAVLRTMVDNMPFEAWVRDEQERLVLENPARVAHYGSQLGLTPAQCAQRPGEAQRWARYNERAWQGEVIEYEMDTEVGGRQRSFLCIVAPLRHGAAVRGLVGFNIDVTPRKEAERHAHEKDAQLASILLQMPGGVSRLDRELRFQFVNEAHARWFGQPAEAMRGQPLSAIVSPARLQRMLPYVEQALEGEVVVFENRVELPSGQVRYRHTTLAPERGADGAVTGFIAFAIDTTERKTMELALEQNQARLRALVNALPDMVFLKNAEGV
jgi:PAS domain S-box-containing protein